MGNGRERRMGKEEKGRTWKGDEWEEKRGREGAERKKRGEGEGSPKKRDLHPVFIYTDELTI